MLSQTAEPSQKICGPPRRTPANAGWAAERAFHSPPERLRPPAGYRPLRASTEYAVAVSLMNRPASDAGPRCLFIEAPSHAPDWSRLRSSHAGPLAIWACADAAPGPDDSAARRGRLTKGNVVIR